MSNEDLLQIFEADLRELNLLDSAYYQSSCRSAQDYADYEERKDRRENLRDRLYAAIGTSFPEDTTAFQVAFKDRAADRQIVSPSLCRLAHDLRNKLHIIMGYADLLKESATIDDSMTEKVEHILASARQMTEMINKSTCPNRTQPSRQTKLPELPDCKY